MSRDDATLLDILKAARLDTEFTIGFDRDKLFRLENSPHRLATDPYQTGATCPEQILVKINEHTLRITRPHGFR